MRHIQSRKKIEYHKNRFLQNIRIGILCICILFTILGMVKLWNDPILMEDFWDSKSFFIELILFFFITLWAFFQKPIFRNYFLVIFLMLMLWFHAILLPILVGGIYFYCLCHIGKLVLLPMRRNWARWTEYWAINLAHELMIGSAVYIIGICILSLLGIGDMYTIQICTWSLFLACILLYYGMRSYGIVELSKLGKSQKEIFYYYREKENRRLLYLKGFCFCYILTQLYLQATRINIAIDYDSLRYGLRSLSILNNGKGIYENLGLVNDVYVYPKGLEILALPLNIWDSYGFVLALSFWFCIAILLLVYRILQLYEDERGIAIIGIAMVTSIPGIMNLSISAKTDMITLFFQVLFIYDILLYIKEKENRFLIYGWTALLYTGILKPTSLVFSGGLFIITLLYFYINRKRNQNQILEKIHLWKCKGAWLPVLFAILLVTYRTWYLTGLPITSIFSSIWQRFGFRIKYPFSASALPSSKGAIEGISAIEQFIKRMEAFFILPTGEGIHHMQIAMPGPWMGAMILLLSIGLIYQILRYKLYKSIILREQIRGYLYSIFFGILGLSLFALYQLYQVDGNYFMLLYIIVILLFCWEMMGVFKNYNILLGMGCIPSFILAWILCSITNWAGVIGNTPISWSHLGFYTKNEIKSNIGDYLAMTPRARVLAMEYMPEAYILPGSVQSYTDLTGSGGNVYLVKKLDIFKEYLEFAEIDYIYTNQDFLKEHSRAEEIIRFMLEDKSLKEIIFKENGVEDRETTEGLSLYRYIRRKKVGR